MPNLLDHALTLGHLTLDDRPYDALDSAVLSQIVYMPLEGLDIPDGGVTIKEAFDFLRRTYPEPFTDVYQRKRFTLTEACARTARYGGWRLTDYVNRIDPSREMQFAACTYHPGDGRALITFRGTDLSIAGWKEDLNMSFMSPVPAQAAAVGYVESIAARFGGHLSLCGHSKGGNLSMYSAIYVRRDIQDRIDEVFSFDGPGVDQKALAYEGYEHIKERIYSFIPQGSVVGMLLCYHPVYTVVRSDAIGILQHDAMSWQVEGGAFETVEGLSLAGRLTDETLAIWLNEMDTDNRRLVVQTLYTVVDASRKDTINGLVSDWIGSAGKMLGALREIDPQTRRTVRRIIGSLFSTGAGEIARVLMAEAIRLPGTLFRN